MANEQRNIKAEIENGINELTVKQKEIMKAARVVSLDVMKQDDRKKYNACEAQKRNLQKMLNLIRQVETGYEVYQETALELEAGEDTGLEDETEDAPNV